VPCWLQVRYHIMGLGDQVDMHAIQEMGAVYQYHHQSKGAVDMLPGSHINLDVLHLNTGKS
jgi:hypothetical protein